LASASSSKATSVDVGRDKARRQAKDDRSQSEKIDRLIVASESNTSRLQHLTTVLDKSHSSLAQTISLNSAISSAKMLLAFAEEDLKAEIEKTKYFADAEELVAVKQKEVDSAKSKLRGLLQQSVTLNQRTLS